MAWTQQQRFYWLAEQKRFEEKFFKETCFFHHCYFRYYYHILQK
jgi:hypothetical protein